MANRNEAKITFNAETKAFNASIKNANSELSKLRAEAKLNETQMKNTGTSVEGLERQHENLEAQLKASESKTEALTNKVETAKRVFGENSDEVAKLEVQLINAQTAEEKLRGAVEDCKKQLDAQKEASDDAESATKTLTDAIETQQAELDDLKEKYVDAVLQYGKNSSEAKSLAREIKDLSGELSDNKSKMDAAESAADRLDKSLDDAGDAARNSEGGFTVAKGAIADLASEAVQLGIEKISEFIGYLRELPEETRELRQNMTTLETSFDTMGFTTEQATETWKDLYAVFGQDDRAVEASNLIAKMADNQQDLNDWVTITTGVYGQFQDSLPVEGLAEAAMETSKTGEVTGVLADALNWGAKEGEKYGIALKKNIEFTELSEKELESLTETQRAEYESRKAQYEAIEEYNKSVEEAATAEDFFNLKLQELTTEEERQAFITETLTGLYSDSAKKYEETAEAQMAAKEATAENTLAQAELGEAIEPVTTEWEGLKTELLTAVAPAVQAVSGFLVEAVGWLREHPAVIWIVVGALSALAIAFTVLAVAMAVAAIAASPFMITVLAVIAVIALVGAAIAAVIYYWDEIKAWGISAWEAIKEAWNSAGEWFSTNVIEPVVEFFTELWDTVSETATSVWESIKEFFAGIPEWFSTNVIQPIVDFFTGLWESIVNIWNTICNAVQVAIMLIGEILSAAFQIITLPFMFIWENCKEYVFAAWEWIKEKVNAAITFVSDIISTMWTGIQVITSTVWTAISTFISNIWNAIKEKVTTAINTVKTIVSTIWTGIKTITSTIWNAVVSVVSSVWDSISSKVSTAINAVKGVVSNIWNSIKSTTSNIWNSVKTTISSVWDGIKSTVSNAINNVKNTISNVFTSAKNTISNILDSIKNKFSSIFDTVKSTVSNAIKTIKGYLNFSWELPKIKLPHFSISGSFSLNPPSIPTFSVSWYKDAYDSAKVLKAPMIFGFSAASGKLLGGGDGHGNEVVAGESHLIDLIEGAVEKASNVVNLQALADAIEDIANRPIYLNVNGRRVAVAMAGDSDSVNGLRSTFTERGLVLD